MSRGEYAMLFGPVVVVLLLMVLLFSPTSDTFVINCGSAPPTRVQGTTLYIDKEHLKVYDYGRVVAIFPATCTSFTEK